MKTMTVPVDPINGQPLTTTAMKAECMGEFVMEQGHICANCYGKAQDVDCELCHGEFTYVEKITVPWSMCKEIYKRVAMAAAKEVFTPSLLSPVSPSSPSGPASDHHEVSA